jgi:hypothetical protein
MPWLEDAEPETFLWEGQLEPMRIDATREEPLEADLDPRDLPAVAVGRPETWPLDQLYPRSEMPATLAARVDVADFYLVRLHCTFRPTRDEVAIQWARFMVELVGDGGEPPVAEAIHPEVVEDVSDRSRRFTLAPSLKFAEVEVGVGEASFGFEYKALEPFVFGARDPVPSWDFEPTPARRLYGSRRMHLLVRAPSGSAAGRARLHLTANITRERRLLGRAKIRRDEPPLEATLWGDPPASV